MTVPTATDLIERVRERLAERTGRATVQRFVPGAAAVGVGVAVESATDHGCGHGSVRRTAGVAYNPGESGAELPDVAAGDDALDVAALAHAGDDPAERAVGTATLNALSAPHVDWRTGDPLAALAPDVERIATVGLFRPAFRKFDALDVRVVERDPDAVDADPPEDVAVETYGPDEAGAAFAGVDVLFVTGATLVYGGIDRYLAAARAASVPAVVLVGATASSLPGPVFAAGVTLLAGARVDDEDRVFERIAAGDCGTDLHDAGLRKVYVAREEAPGIDLQASDPKT